MNKLKPLLISKKVWVVVGFVAAGLILLSVSKAATPYLSTEAESGVTACAAQVADTTASGGSAVKFGTCASVNDPYSPLSLDASGTKIPDTNYTIPAGAIFMATNGNDTNAGTQASPVKTINKAYALVPSGGTIVVRGGTYRDWYYQTPDTYGAIITKPLTLQAYPHEQVWFDGMDVVSSGWTANADGTWSIPWSTPSFCSNNYYSRPIDQQVPSGSGNSGPCYHIDMSGDPSNPRAGDPQMVHINGTYIHQVTSRDQAANNPSNFYYDHTNRVIYIGTNPSGKTVELTKRPMFAIFGASGSTNIKGLGFKRYATVEFDGFASTAVAVSGGYDANKTPSIIENNVFTRMAGGSLAGKALGGIIRHNALVNNGYTGMGSNGHSKPTGSIDDNLLMEGNLVSNNNTEKFGTNCTASCGHAGVKLAHMNGFTIRNNIFEKTKNGAGFWCDNDCRNAVIVNNVFRQNDSAGLFYEVSSYGIIASNLIINNGSYGMQIASANMKIYNNTLINNNAISIWIYDDHRNQNNLQGTQIGPDTIDVNILNNVIYGGNMQTMKFSSGSSTYPLNTKPSQYMNTLDYNDYYRSGGAQKPLFNWVEPDPTSTIYRSIPELQAARGAKYEVHGHDISSGTDPFFVNLAGGDYAVRSGSTAYKSGKALPADVAAALGVPSGTITSRGALSWPGK